MVQPDVEFIYFFKSILINKIVNTLILNTLASYPVFRHPSSLLAHSVSQNDLLLSIEAEALKYRFRDYNRLWPNSSSDRNHQ